MYKKTVSETEQKIYQTDLSNAKDVLSLTREVDNHDLWKIYGRESEAGKMLFKLFGKGPQSIKIDYPKPKTEKKPLPYQQSTLKSTMAPPQKTVIEYPPVNNPSRRLPKIHAVDLIPKRKNEAEIKKEMDDYYSKPQIPSNKGVNRKMMIADLQTKFKKQRGALPKGAELPLAQDDIPMSNEVDEEDLKLRALQKVPKKLLAFTYEKPKREEDNKKGLSKHEEDEELEKLYSEIEQEIEDRQNYLEEISSLDEPKLKEKVKKEIIERVAELQKIIQMLRRKE